jgi:cytochrome c
MRFPISTLVCGALLTIAGRGLAAAVDVGKTAFKKCALCHATEAGKDNKIGPSLFGVVGRKSAGLENFSYSEG